MKRLFCVLVSVICLVGASAASDPVFTGIVASKSFTGITSDLSNSTLYTPDSDGMFRVSSCVENSSHVGGVGISISWTDVFGTGQSSNFSVSNSGTFCNTSSFVFRDKATNSIQISTSSINTCSCTANVYAVVERLQ